MEVGTLEKPTEVIELIIESIEIDDEELPVLVLSNKDKTERTKFALDWNTVAGIIFEIDGDEFNNSFQLSSSVVEITSPHITLDELIEKTELYIEKTLIDEYDKRDNIIKSKLFLQNKRQRESDSIVLNIPIGMAVALAARTETPIYVEVEIFKKIKASNRLSDLSPKEQLQILEQMDPDMMGQT
ncbi:MAG: hypothetical protein ABII97_00985 [Patescibacteria group bacterium]